MSSGEPKTVYRAGGKEVNIGGETFLGDPVMIGRYYGALERNDLKESERLARLLTKNRFGSPIAPTQEPAAPTAQAPLTAAGVEIKPSPVGESVQERKARTDREEAERASKLKIQETVDIESIKKERELQRSILESREDASSQKRNSEKLIKIFSDKGIQEVLGPTAKPGVKAAFLEIASNPLDVAGNKVAITNLQKALVQSKATQEQIDKLNVANSTLKLIELSTAKTFLKGQGAVSNSERELISEINGSVYKDPANALLYKAQLAFVQADMKDRYIKTFQNWKDKHPDGTVEQFNRTNAYNEIETSYGKQLDKIGETIKLGKPAPTTKAKPETPMATVRNKINSLLQ